MTDVPADIFRISFQPEPTIKKFLRSTVFVRGVLGPIGSGKSTGCCWEIFRRMAKQEPGPDGKRRTRWAVVRNTYPELETTTIKTWLDWFPENIFGKFYKRVPYRHDVRFNDVEAEVYFIALDRAEDVKKLLSLELTGAWINEAREVPLEIVTTIRDRVGRYPAMRDGGPTWEGVIMDTNAPEEDHWWAWMSGEVDPPEGTIPPDASDFQFFRQPPAAIERRHRGQTIWEDNPKAENLGNLPKNYYKKRRSGNTHAHIRVYQACKYGTVMAGKPVYEDEWDEEVHLAREILVPNPHLDVIVGIDCGRTPSAILSQRDQQGAWMDFNELVCDGMGAELFAQELGAFLSREYPEIEAKKFKFFGDPAGDHGRETSETTFFSVLRAHGMQVHGVETNEWNMRYEAGARCMRKMVRGKPGYLVSPKCRVLIKGFRGKFRYPEIKAGARTHGSVPEKNEWSHPHEARQYGYIGGGEVADMLNRKRNLRGSRTFKAKTSFNPLKSIGGSRSAGRRF